jgi:hypothetical protein
VIVVSDINFVCFLHLRSLIEGIEEIVAADETDTPPVASAMVAVEETPTQITILDAAMKVSILSFNFGAKTFRVIR